MLALQTLRVFLLHLQTLSCALAFICKQLRVFYIQFANICLWFDIYLQTLRVFSVHLQTFPGSLTFICQHYEYFTFAFDKHLLVFLAYIL